MDAKGIFIYNEIWKMEPNTNLTDLQYFQEEKQKQNKKPQLQNYDVHDK